MRNIRLDICYDGTRYRGWQRLPGKDDTLQGKLETALSRILEEPIEISGSGRTDAGVHARGFVCKAEGIPDGIPPEKVPVALGSRLPADISVLEAWEVPEDFHPRYHAKGKEYIYRVRNARVRDPFDADVTCLWQKQIDHVLCDELCRQFVGKHDFRSFMAAGSDITDTVRTVYDFSCRREREAVLFTISADGFLYNMVRILVGTVLDLADGTLKSTPKDILASCDRTKAGRTMPPTGLCLEKVFY